MLMPRSTSIPFLWYEFQFAPVNIVFSFDNQILKYLTDTNKSVIQIINDVLKAMYKGSY